MRVYFCSRDSREYLGSICVKTTTIFAICEFFIACIFRGVNLLHSTRRHLNNLFYTALKQRFVNVKESYFVKLIINYKTKFCYLSPVINFT